MTATELFSHRKFWAKRLVPAPVPPMTRDEMDALGWDACDVILVTGDAYVDHPSFGAALIGRVLEAQGFRVGVIAQPDWRSTEDFRALGKPGLFFGVTAGNMDSMVANYTADGRIRSDDPFSPDDAPHRRPDRASIVYANRCREAFPDAPVILGGLEASLRRAAHYDYWSERVRRSILLDAKADMLIYGSAERAVVEVAHRLAAGAPIGTIDDVAGTVFDRPASGEGDGVRIPPFEEVRADPDAYNRAAMTLHRAVWPGHDQPILQRHGDRDVWIRPPAAPLATAELDRIYELPFTRLPHPAYAGRRLKSHEMIRFSVCILRGCFGGCAFCALSCHEGPSVQSRSEESILREIELLRDTAPGFTGVISDLGGPTANMYRMGCQREEGAKGCKRLSCLVPSICRNLETSHAPLIRLYRKARAIPGVKKVLIGSGIRYDLALGSPEYIRELAEHHVGGYLKVAPEHIAEGPLRCMNKPGPETFERFMELFGRFSREAGKEQYLVPYLLAAHPGTTDEDMLELALWLKKHDFRPEQVQTFLPSPMTLATAMYHTGRSPLDGSEVVVPKGRNARRRQKAFLRYHDPASWPILREALGRMGRAERIGSGKRHLVPAGSRKPRRRSAD